MSNINEEVYEVLSNQDEIEFEEILDESSSPLNQPVVDKDVGSIPSNDSQNATQPNNEQVNDTTPTDGYDAEYMEAEEVDDASEQNINEGYSETIVIDGDEDFEIPIGHATQAADSILGIANNVLEIGGGFFVKIKKHKEFYDFDEIIQVIEKQNDKNVKRIKLDDEDKALLRPLLITILKRKAQKLTPEQQLMGAFISIMMKKAQVVMEIKAENEILVERILDIVREEKGYSDQDEVEVDEEEKEPQEEKKQVPKNETPTAHQQEVEDFEFVESDDDLIEELLFDPDIPSAIQVEDVMEIADDEPKEKEQGKKEEKDSKEEK
jgi:hypothetical protein